MSHAGGVDGFHALLLETTELIDYSEGQGSPTIGNIHFEVLVALH